MGTVRVTKTYAKSEFSSASSVNISMFKDEVEQLGITDPTTIFASGTDVVVRWDDVLPTSDDITAVDGAVEDHAGGTTSSEATLMTDADASYNSTPVWDTKLDVSTGMLVAGTYEVMWQAEIAIDAEDASICSEFRAVVNDEAEMSVKNYRTEWLPVVGYRSVSVSEGEAIAVSLDFRKCGAKANMAKIRKAQVSIKAIAG